MIAVLGSHDPCRRWVKRDNRKAWELRYALDEVEAALGIEAVNDDAPIAGLVSDTFEPLGVHDLRPVPSGGSMAAEVVALGVRDAPESREHATTPRWGGGLLNARVPVA